MKMGLLATLATVSSIFVASACGGASDTELFSPAGSSEFGTAPDGTSGDVGGGSTGTSSSGSSGLSSSGGSSSSSSGGSSSSSGGSSSGGSSSSSSSSSSGGSSSGGADAGPPPASPGILCGKQAGAKVYCAAATQVCCASFGNPGPGGDLELSCQPNNGIVKCPGARTIACDDRTDCPAGQVCCGLLENSGYTGVACRTQCGGIPGVQAVRFCDPSAPVDECAEIGRTCGQSQSLPGYGVCK